MKDKKKLARLKSQRLIEKYRNKRFWSEFSFYNNRCADSVRAGYVRSYYINAILVFLFFVILFVSSEVDEFLSARSTAFINIQSSENSLKIFKVKIVKSKKDKKKGLMGVRYMGENKGMLFVYKSPRNDIAFWMKNTLIPLDMLFISGDGEILKIHENAIPHDETPIYAGVGVKSVLEINGGLSKKFGIAAGDYVTLHSSGDTSD